MFPDFDYIKEFKKDWNKKVKKMKILCMILSIFMIIVGIICLFFPMNVFSITKAIVSLTFIGIGLYFIIHYFLTSSYFKEPSIILLGLIHILFGILLFKMPKEITAMSLTMMLSIVLLFYGVEKISLSRKLRYIGLFHSYTYSFNGMMTITLGILFMILPMTSVFIIDYIIASYFLISGISLFIETIHMKTI